MSDNVTEECEAILENVTIPDVTVDFVNTREIEFVKNWGHRYGFGDNITAVISGDEDASNYLKGLIATNITFFIFFVVWILLVFVFKCGGSKRVGGLSGKIQVQPKPVREDFDEKQDGNPATGDYLYHQDLDKWEEHYKKQKRNHTIAVWTIVFSGLCIIVCALLMSIKGVQSLATSLDNGIDTFGQVQDLCIRGVEIIDAGLENEKLSGEEILKFLEGMNVVCGDSEGKLCTNITDVTTCDFDGLDEIINESVLKDFIDLYNSQWDALYRNLGNLRGDLMDIHNVAGKLSNNASSFYWAFQIARVFALILAGLCLLIIHGVLFTKWRKFYKWLRRCVLIPLFVILVTLCYLFSLIFVIGSKSLADVCYNSPDPNMLLLLDRFKSRFSPILYNAIVFYINQCPITGAVAEIEETLTYLFAAVKQIFAFITTIATFGSEGVKAICEGNQGDAMPTNTAVPPEYYQQPVIQLAESVQIRICELVAWLLSIRDYFQCVNWHPLYSTSVWEAMCFNGTDGFLYVSASQLGIVCFSMVLLTARVGFFEFPTVKEKGGSDGEERKGDNESNNMEVDDQENDQDLPHSTEESSYHA